MAPAGHTHIAVVKSVWCGLGIVSGPIPYGYTTQSTFTMLYTNLRFSPPFSST